MAKLNNKNKQNWMKFDTRFLRSPMLKLEMHKFLQYCYVIPFDEIKYKTTVIQIV